MWTWKEDPLLLLFTLGSFTSCPFSMELACWLTQFEQIPSSLQSLSLESHQLEPLPSSWSSIHYCLSFAAPLDSFMVFKQRPDSFTCPGCIVRSWNCFLWFPLESLWVCFLLFFWTFFLLFLTSFPLWCPCLSDCHSCCPSLIPFTWQKEYLYKGREKRWEKRDFWHWLTPETPGLIVHALTLPFLVPVILIPSSSLIVPFSLFSPHPSLDTHICVCPSQSTDTGIIPGQPSLLWSFGSTQVITDTCSGRSSLFICTWKNFRNQPSLYCMPDTGWQWNERRDRILSFTLFCVLFQNRFVLKPTKYLTGFTSFCCVRVLSSLCFSFPDSHRDPHQRKEPKGSHLYLFCISSSSLLMQEIRLWTQSMCIRVIKGSFNCWSKDPWRRGSSRRGWKVISRFDEEWELLPLGIRGYRGVSCREMNAWRRRRR